MKLVWALAALAIGCNGSKPATSGGGSGSGSADPVAAASWKLGGLDVPVSFIPKTLGTMPTVLPIKPGAPYRLSDFPDDPPNVEHKLIAGYATGDAPHDDVILGYDHLAKVDLLPDLTKAWGAPVHAPTAAGTSDCWPETNKVKTCWVRFGEQTVWHLRYTTDVVAAAPAPPPDAKSTAVFTDQPLGKGACGLISVKEASEILGVQLKITEKDDADVCRYGAGDLELTVMRRPNAIHELSEKWKIDGFADKASYDFADALVFIQNGKGFYISLIDASRTSVQHRELVLALGKKVVARLAKK